MSSTSLIVESSPKSQITSSSVAYQYSNNNNNTSVCNDSGIVEDSEIGCGSPLQFPDESPPSKSINEPSNNSKTKRRRSTLRHFSQRSVGAENISSTRKVKSFPFESAGLRHRVTVENSSVIVSRLEAVSLSTGARMTLFKCHLCGKMFGRLGELQTHLTAHSEHCITLFQCRLCDTNFPFKTKLIRHLRLRHRINIPPKVKIPDASVSSMIDCNKDKYGENCSPDNRNIVVDTTTTHDDSRIDNMFNFTRLPSGIDRVFASSLIAKDSVVSKDNNENILSRHCDSNATSQFKCEFNEHSSCVSSFEDWQDVARLNINESSVACEQNPIHKNNAKEVHCNQAIRRKKFVCRSCGAQFRKRRNLYQHSMQFHKCGGAIDHSPVKKQLHSVGELTSNHIYDDSLKQPDCENKLNALTDAVNSASQRSDDLWSCNASSNYSRSVGVHSDQRSAVRNYNGEDGTINDASVNETDSLEQINDVISASEDGKRLSSPTLDDAKSRTNERSSGSAKHSSDSTAADEIRSAPIKSILSPNQFKTKRRHSTAAISSQSTITTAVIKTEEEDAYYRDAAANSAFFSSSQSFAGLGSMMSGGAPFNLTDVSPLLRGGYLPLPLISFFLSQSALASSSLLSGATIPGSFFCGGGGGQISPHVQSAELMSADKESSEVSEEGCESSTECTSQFSTSPKVTASKCNDTVAPVYEGDVEDMTTTQAADALTDITDWRASLERRMKGFSVKGTSLSKTQSRLYVVPEPVKRTEAFKPILMADGQTVYRCAYCNKDFSTVSDINRHMDFHEDIRPYKCSHCDYHARTNSQLKVHNMRHQGIRKFQCCLCNYKGVTQSDLNRHAKSQIHVLKSRNQCGSCGEGFVSPVNLGKHFHERHTGGGVISSSNCLGSGGVKTEI